MVITFCGHSKYEGTAEDEIKILKLLNQKAGNSSVEFFLGGYGGFDWFTYRCAKKFQKEHKDAKLIWITPYLNIPLADDKKRRFDLIVYLELEKIPLKYAIVYRNRWMVEQADIVISYIINQTAFSYHPQEEYSNKVLSISVSHLYVLFEIFSHNDR